MLTLSAQQPAPPRAGAAAAPGKLTLTVDSIMRGPDLVGYPPSGLRWSGDSRDLFFEWRKPGEKESATYVLSQNTTTPRRLTDEERKLAPPVGGAWDEARRRVVFADGGDIVVLDTVARTRQQVTRTTAPESGPRWARNDTAVTFVSQNNLFMVPLATGSIEQLTDVKPRRRETRDTDSQKFVREQEAALLQVTREAVEQRKADEEKRKKDALPEFEITERQSVAQLTLHPSETWVFLLVADRAEAKNAVVPNYVTESGYTEDIPSRSKVGDVQDRQRLAMLNLKTRTSVWADASFAGTAKVQGKDEPRDVRWSAPIVSPDGRLVVATARSDGFQGPLDRGPRPGIRQVPRHRRAPRRRVDPRGGRRTVRRGRHGLDARRPQPLVPLRARRLDAPLCRRRGAAWAPRRRSARRARSNSRRRSSSRDKTKFYLVTSEVHPGERHMYEMPVDGGPRTRLTTMTGSNIGEVSPDGAMIGVHPVVGDQAARGLRDAEQGRRPGPAGDHVADRRSGGPFSWIEPEVITFKARDGEDVYARLYTPEMIGAARDRTQARA